MLDAEAFAVAVERALARGERPALLRIDLHAADGLPSASGARRSALDVAVQARLTRAIRPGDVVGTLAVDRYAVLAREDHGAQGAQRIAERIAERLREPFEIGGEEIDVKPRIGVGVIEGEAATPQELVERAERAQADPSC